MTKAEIVALRITTDFFNKMQKPEFRGPSFNEITFDIENFVKCRLHIYYKKGIVPPHSMEKALIKSRNKWNKLVNEMQLIVNKTMRFLHSSYQGSYYIECEVIRQLKNKSYIKYTDPISQIIKRRWIWNTRLDSIPIKEIMDEKTIESIKRNLYVHGQVLIMMKNNTTQVLDPSKYNIEIL